MNITPNSFLPQHRINSCGTEIPVKIKSPQPNNEFFISTADGFAPREAVQEASRKIPVFLQDCGSSHNHDASYEATAKAAAFSIMPGPSGPAIASSLEQASEIRPPINYIPDAETKSMEKALGAIAADKISGIPKENLSQMEDSLGKSSLESEFREMEISGHLEKQAVRDSNLSLSEKTALYIYTDSAYKAINNALRTHDTAKIEKFRPIIEKAETALSKLPSFSGSVCRNANLPKEFLEQHHPGAIITYSSFTSTSSEKISGFDGNAEIMIDCSPNGSKGRRTACPGKYLYEMLEGFGKIGEKKGEEKIKVYAHDHRVGISIGGKTYSVNASEIPPSVLAALMDSGELTLSLIK